MALAREQLGSHLDAGDRQLDHRNERRRISSTVCPASCGGSTTWSSTCSRSGPSSTASSRGAPGDACGSPSRARRHHPVAARGAGQPQARGQWGERMADDVLRLAGFVEGVNYRKQTAVAGGHDPRLHVPAARRPGAAHGREVPGRQLPALPRGRRPTPSAPATASAFLRDVRGGSRSSPAAATSSRASPSTTCCCSSPTRASTASSTSTTRARSTTRSARRSCCARRSRCSRCWPSSARRSTASLLERASDEILECSAGFGAQWDKFTEPWIGSAGGSTRAQRAYEELAGPRRQLRRSTSRRPRPHRRVPTAGNACGSTSRRASADRLAAHDRDAAPTRAADVRPGRRGTCGAPDHAHERPGADDAGVWGLTVAGNAAPSWPLLPDDADLLRQRRAPHRPRLHDGHRRRPGPLAPAARRRRLVPHRHRRARPQGRSGPPRPTASPRRSGPTARRARSRRRGDLLDIAYDDFIRTTEPRHYAGGAGAAPAGATTTATSTRAPTRASTAWPARRTTAETEPLDRTGCARSTAARSSRSTEENYFFKLSAFEQPLLDWYERHPDAVAARRPSATRRSASSARACRTSRSPARRSRGASRCRGTTATSSTSGTTRSINYATAVGYGSRPGALRALVAGRPPPHRQGHPALPLRVLAGDAAGGRHRAAPPRQRARLAAGGRREDEQDRAQPDRPRRPRRRLRRRRLPLPLPARQHRSGPTATSATRAWSPATTPTWPTTSATCCRGWPPWSAKKCGGIGPAPSPDSPLAAVAAEAYAGAAAAWDGASSRRSRSRPRGGSSARPTPSSRPTSRGRPSPAPSVDARAGRRARGAAHRGRPGQPGASRHAAPRSGDASASAARPTDQRLPEAAAWGGYPGGLRGREGRAAVPPRLRG